MGARLTAAVLAGRLAATLSRRAGRGGGTVIAGHVATAVLPATLSALTSRLALGNVLVTGTNGKTTTCRLLASLLRAHGRTPVHNRAGANLISGITSAVVEQFSPDADIGLFEVDEATLPAALGAITPRAVVITNLFRDQLDRYGEVHFVAGLWRDAIARLPDGVILVLNADDPLVADLGRDRPNVFYFGIDDPTIALDDPPHASDARLCGRCGAAFTYSATHYGHLGHYRCDACHVERPRPNTSVTRVGPIADTGTRLTIRATDDSIELTTGLIGTYNAYNIAAATASAVSLGVPIDLIPAAIGGLRAAFGRLERLNLGGRSLLLALVKNPVGFGEVLRTLLAADRPLYLLIAINDDFADGTDISWLWDVDFERLAGRVASVTCSGARADDMAVRLKYALVDTTLVSTEPSLATALDRAMERVPEGETLNILPTYTAMLTARAELTRRDCALDFWAD
jgi:UDP-N-acetylmuramyl tripeptide synthase